MLRNAVSAYGARLSLGAAAVAAPVAVAQCAKDDKKSVTSSFDPEALERGAKALREINSSVHAKRVRPGRRGIGRRRRRALDRRAFARRFADRRDRSSRADRAPVFSFPSSSSSSSSSRTRTTTERATETTSFEEGR
jgi:hypothetical protein